MFETACGSAVRCTIEGSTLTAKDDPSTLGTFCLAEYQLCTTWEAEKQRIERGQMAGLLDRDPDRDKLNREVDEWKDKLVTQAPEVEVTRFYQDE